MYTKVSFTSASIVNTLMGGTFDLKAYIMLQGSIVTAPAGSHGFDCNTKLTGASAKAMKASGFAFAVRYLSLSRSPPAGDLSTGEAQAILAAGLALMPVQHVARPGWLPSKSKGATNGQNAVSHASAIGIPPGVCCWMDLEGIRHDAAPEDVIDYSNAWIDVVAQAGYVPGVYVGSECILTGDQLFWRLKTAHYWKSGSSVPAIPERGYCMTQRIVAGDKINGIEIDRDVTKIDSLGNAPIWLAI